jgi:D-galactarolactone cycloisomerase
LAAAIPNAKYVEYLTPAKYIENILTEPFLVDEQGFLGIPDKPGLGIELDRDALAQFSC